MRRSGLLLIGMLWLALTGVRGVYAVEELVPKQVQENKENPNETVLKPGLLGKRGPQTCEGSAQERAALEMAGILVSDVDPKTYLIQNGDTFQLNVFRPGERSQFYPELNVQNGSLLLEFIGEVHIAGKPLGRVVDYVHTLYRKKFPQFRARLELKKLRSFPVSITGQVGAPGSYRVTPLTRVSALLTMACGLTQTGSSLNITLNRRKAPISLNLEAFMFEGKLDQNPTLEPADHVFVPRIGSMVEISGAVVEPKVYELIPGETAGNLITRAGGALPGTDEKAVQLFRVEEAPGGPQTRLGLLDLTAGGGEKPLRAGDRLHLAPYTDQSFGQIRVSGVVRQPGLIRWVEGMTLKQAILEAGGFGFDADAQRVAVERAIKDSDRLEKFTVDATNLVPNSLYAASDNPANADFMVKQGDHIIVPERLEQAAFVYAEGYLRHPGRFTLKKDMRIRDLFWEAGGPLMTEPPFEASKTPNPVVARTETSTYGDNPSLNNYADLSEAHLVRFLKNGDKTRISLSLSFIINNPKSQDNLLLEPNDRLILGRTPHVVFISGAVDRTGLYPFYPGLTVSELIYRAGPSQRANLGKIQLRRGDVPLRHVSMEEELEAGDRLFIGKTKIRWYHSSALQSFTGFFSVYGLIRSISNK